MSKPLLRCEGLTRRFEGVVAVEELTLEIGDEPQVTGLIGPNGAGKTTVFNLISSLLPPTAGRIWLNDADITGESPHSVRHRGVARTYQDVRVFQSLSAVDNVAVAASSSGQFRGITAARAAGTEMLAEVGFRGDRATPASSLSVYERKQVDLARALVTSPKLLLLDEFLAGLGDEEMGRALRLIDQLIEEKGLVVLLVEHVMSAIMKLSARVVVLDAGRLIADGAPEEIVSDPRVVEAYLGARWTQAGNSSSVE